MHIQPNTIKKKTFWLSYDLGIRGDYNSLYRWLDKYKAKECGNGLAVFSFPLKSNDPKKEIKEDILNSVEFATTDRVYLIWRDDEKQLNFGSFLVGNRKPAPWEGYFSEGQEEQVDY